MGVVESSQCQRLAELAVVQKIRRDLIISVEPEFEHRAVLSTRCVAMERDLLIDTGVEIVRPLRQPPDLYRRLPTHRSYC